MANTRIDPNHIAPPAANYAHAVLSDGPAQLLHTSGVVPVAPDGTVPEAIADQARVVWANITAMLTEAGLVPHDVVSVTTYVVPGEDMGAVMAERDRALGGHRAASTLVVVPELAQPAWKMEIAVVAAR
jgi:enamine deaminase RidA (YjgF/YER057c/UK114 family)